VRPPLCTVLFLPTINVDVDVIAVNQYLYVRKIEKKKWVKFAINTTGQYQVKAIILNIDNEI